MDVETENRDEYQLWWQQISGSEEHQQANIEFETVAANDKCDHRSEKERDKDGRDRDFERVNEVFPHLGLN